MAKRKGKQPKIAPSRVEMRGETTKYNPNILIVVDHPRDGIQLHYNLNIVNRDTPQIFIELGDKDVDLVAEECRIRLKDLGKCDLKIVLQTIEDIKGEKLI